MSDLDPADDEYWASQDEGDEPEEEPLRRDVGGEGVRQ